MDLILFFLILEDFISSNLLEDILVNILNVEIGMLKILLLFNFVLLGNF